MSYSRTPGLGAFQAGDVYPAGTQVIGGFQVVGLPSASAANAVAQLRGAIGASFSIGGVAPASAPAPRNRFHEIGQRAGLPVSAPSRARDSVGWGPSYGVPSGRLYALIVTDRDGVTGAQINSALAAVARDLRARLGGLVVNLTNAHTLGGAAPLPSLTPDTGPDGSLIPVENGSSLSPLLIGGVAATGLSVLVGAWLWFGRRAVARNRRTR